MRMCAYGGERQPGCLRASTQPFFLYSHEVLLCGRGLRACRVLRTRPLCLGSIYPLNCRWPHNCLLCAHTQTHLHSAGQTADADPFAIVIQVNVRTDMSGGTWDRWKECTWTALFLWTMCCSAFSTVAVLTQLRHRRPKVCRSIHRWDPRVHHVCIMEHVPLRQSIKCNLCPVTPEELKQPQGVVSTWPCEFQISPLLALRGFLSWSIFKSLSTSWHISRTLCSLDHRREANLRYLILKNAQGFKAKISTNPLLPYVGKQAHLPFRDGYFPSKLQASDGLIWLVYCTLQINLSVWSLCSHTARCDLLPRVMYDADMARGDVHISGSMIYLFSKQGSNVLCVLISNKIKQLSLILQQVDLSSQSNGGKKRWILTQRYIYSQANRKMLHGHAWIKSFSHFNYIIPPINKNQTLLSLCDDTVAVLETRNYLDMLEA